MEPTEDSIPETTEAEAVPVPAPAPMYVVHGIMRKVAHRTFRAQNARHTGRKAYVGANQTRLVPGQRLLISEAVLHRDIEDLRTKAAMHVLEVRTPDGRLVDLETLAAGPAAPKVVQPHPVLDSVANDKPVGQYIPPYVGDDTAMPTVLKPGEKPALLVEAGIEFEQPAVLDIPEPPVDLTVDAGLDDAVDAAQQEATEEEPPPPAPTGQKPVSSGEGQSRKNRRNR